MPGSNTIGWILNSLFTFCHKLYTTRETGVSGLRYLTLEADKTDLTLTFDLNFLLCTTKLRNTATVKILFCGFLIGGFVNINSESNLVIFLMMSLRMIITWLLR